MMASEWLWLPLGLGVLTLYLVLSARTEMFTRWPGRDRER
jgi:hypothetical protein